MGAFDWSAIPAQNTIADPLVRATDGVTAREYPGLVRGVQAGVAALTADQGGALVTGGTGDAYTAATKSGVKALRLGVRLVVKADRNSQQAPTFSPDGLAPRPWLDSAGQPARVRQGGVYTLTADPDRGWISDALPNLAVADISGLPTALAGKTSPGDVAATVAPIQSAVATLQAGQASAALTYDTLAQLNANLTPAAGATAQVINDGVNNGFYAKSGASGAGSWAKKSSATVPALDARGTYIEADKLTAYGSPLPLVSDMEGVFGNTPAIYLPRSIFLENGGVAFNGYGGADSGVLPGYTGFAINQFSATTIYLDLDAAQPYQKVEHPAVVPTGRPSRVHVLATIYGNQITTRLPVVKVDGSDYSASRIAPYTQLIQENGADGNLLLIPQLYFYLKGLTNGLEGFKPNGASHAAFSIPGDPLVERRIFFDPIGAHAGNSIPFVVQDSQSGLKVGGPLRILVATMLGGVIIPGPGLSVIGGPQGGIARNQCPTTLDATRSPGFYATSAPAVLTDATLTGLGFTGGVYDPTGTDPFFEEDIEPVAGGTVFARWYVQSGTDNQFGDPTAYIIDRDTGGIVAVNNLSGGSVQLEYARTARVASFITRIALPGNLPARCRIRVGTRSAASSWRVCGLQFASARSSVNWIARDDKSALATRSGADARMPRLLSATEPLDAVFGADLYMCQGDELPFYPTAGLAQRIEGASLACTMAAVPAKPGGAPVYRTSVDQIMVPANRVGATGTFVMRQRGLGREDRYTLGVRNWVSPAQVTGSPKILLIGDSLTNRRIGDMLSLKLQALGVTPTFLGTMRGAGVSDNDFGNGVGGVLGEAREGWAWADFIGLDTRYQSVATGSEAAYLAASKATQNGQNPFLRIANGADPAGRVFNGQIFDFGQYLTRFLGGAVPDIVVIVLGQNDMFRAGTPAAALAQVNSGLGAVLPSIRAAGANIQIGLGLHAPARSYEGDAPDLAYRIPILRALTAYQRSGVDAKLSIIPYWQHMCSEWGWGVATTVADQAATGVGASRVSDYVHFEDIQRHQVAHLTSRFIAKLLSGGTAYGPA